jgi:O-antigen ligase
MVLVCLLAMYFLIGVQVARRIPASSILSGDTIEIARNKCSDIGYSAVDTSVFLAGAFWSMIASLPLLSKKKHKVILLAAAGLILFSQALTGGRAGYVAWGATGFILCLLKWRKYLLLAPVVVILLPILMPGAVERMFAGFGIIDVSGQSTANKKLITAGRMTIWPYVINKIGDSPIIGHGRLGMNRTGLDATIETEHYGIGAAQPHNMYLETLLDNGILGSIPILLFWAILFIYAGRLFTSENRLCSAAGGTAMAMMLTQLVAGLGSQHFYPEESTLGVWASMFLMMRVYLEKSKAQEDIATVINDWDGRLLHQQAAITAIHTYQPNN